MRNVHSKYCRQAYLVPRITFHTKFELITKYSDKLLRVAVRFIDEGYLGKLKVVTDPSCKQARQPPTHFFAV